MLSEKTFNQARQNSINSLNGVLQRKCACGGSSPTEQCVECSKKKMPLQRQPDGRTEAATIPPIVHDVLSSQGRLLDSQTRAFFEARFRHDFSTVRVHADTKAAESARLINARAYTVGQNIVFAAGQFAPDTPRGKRVLAHELVHTIQQSNVGKPFQVAVCPQNDDREREANLWGDSIAAERCLGLPIDNLRHSHFVSPTILQRLSNLDHDVKKTESKSFAGTQPLIVKVASDCVVIINAQGQAETVSMSAFGSPAWEPGSPANPAVMGANDTYQKARIEILTAAGQRPAATFEGWNCDDEQKRRLRNDLRLAVMSVYTALDKLKLAQAGVKSALKEVEFHFKTQIPEDITALIGNFSQVKNELGNVTAFSCGGIYCNMKRESIAWVRPLGGPASQINICELYWDLNTFERVLTLVHEATHRAFGTGDPAYYEDALNIPREKAMDNAESYGNYALGKYNQRIK